MLKNLKEWTDHPYIQERRAGENPMAECRAESNEEVDRDKRYSQIIGILKDNPDGLTAREISQSMVARAYIPRAERNFASPRLTELMQRGRVEPIGKKKCFFTDRMVTVFKLVKEKD